MSEKDIQRKELLVKKVLSLLHNKNLKDSIEILANVFLELGVDSMDVPPESITHKTLIDVVLDDVKEKGETIPNSLARQGILILSWLNKDKI